MQVFVLDDNRKPLDPVPDGAGPDPAQARVERRSSGDSRSRSSSRIGASTTRPCTSTGSRSIPARRRPALPSSRRRRAGSSPRSRSSTGARRSRRRSRTGRPSAEARRPRKTRYRKPRFDNRDAAGGLAPAVAREPRRQRADLGRAGCCRLCPITAASQELVRFDLQKEQNPEIAGHRVPARHAGRLRVAGVPAREVRPHVRLLRQDRRAAPGRAHRPAEPGRDRPRLESHPGVRAVQPSQGQPARRGLPEEGAGGPGEGPEASQERRSRTPRRSTPPAGSCSAGSRRPACRSRAGSGGRTKFNRTTRGLPKTHWLDAACVGASTPETLSASKASGRCWSRRAAMASGTAAGRTSTASRSGTPRGRRSYQGFRTGDIVRADIPNGKHRGTHTGRIAIRYRPSFRMGAIDVHPDQLTVVHRADGYNYSLRRNHRESVPYGADLLLPTGKPGGSRKSERKFLVSSVCSVVNLSLLCPLW